MLQRVITTFYEWSGGNPEGKEFDKLMEKLQRRTGKAIKYVFLIMALLFAVSLLRG